MAVKTKWGVCIHCRLLSVKRAPDGTYLLWCDRRQRRVPESIVWRRRCRGFEPLLPEESAN